MPEVSDHTGELDGQPVFWRSAPSQGTPTLYLHGVPTSSDDWVPFLERTGGVAPDLPGFGRSGKRGDLDFTMSGYDRFVEEFLALADLPQINLVVHDWGVVGLLWAQRFPERVRSLVVINAVPLLSGYRWHLIARIWRTPGLGELVMGGTSRAAVKILTRNATPRPGPMPDAFVDSVLAHFDQGTQRAILRLYRGAPPQALAAAGSGLGTLPCPALVAWGDHDPYIPPRFADAYGETLPNARVVHLPDAGHWPWYERPDLIETVADHLGAA